VTRLRQGSVAAGARLPLLALPVDLPAGAIPVLEEIARERTRQVVVKGYTASHDDEHVFGELANTAACYAAAPDLGTVWYRNIVLKTYHQVWPFGGDGPKPRPRRRALVIAAALLVAEIERLDGANAVREGES